jgi:tagaturonate reductase
MATLSAHVLPLLSFQTDVSMPALPLQPLPERVLQFGTGVLLRGLPDYLIDKANRQGIFNGRIAVVKSTEGGDFDVFGRQNNLYTLCIRGVENQQLVEQNVVCSSISRVLSARQQWNEILRIGASPDLQLVISNTTEIGIQLVAENIREAPPESFPGKLLAVLYARYMAFAGDLSKGLVIVPTELLPDNGTKLEAILLELAHRNELAPSFIDWLEQANTFCNSLVDRIVPGKPEPAHYQTIKEQIGYNDDLLTVTEVYRLWAIEVPENADIERVKSVLSFYQADENVLIQHNIDEIRELKLRLLNGTHTLSCGLAFLGGFETVGQAMADEQMAGFVQELIKTDLISGLTPGVDQKVSLAFGHQVLDRFRNPFIKHRWLAITLQYSMKMQQRNVPVLWQYYQQQQGTPRFMALGFAAYLLFMRGTTQQNGIWCGERNGVAYPIQDPQAGYFGDLWARMSPQELTQTALQNQVLWGKDLTQLSGFAEEVSYYLTQLLDTGVMATLNTLLSDLAPVASTIR